MLCMHIEYKTKIFILFYLKKYLPIFIYKLLLWFAYEAQCSIQKWFSYNIKLFDHRNLYLIDK